MAVNKIILNGEEIELSDEQARRIIGSGTLGTVAQTLIGGVNELDTKVGDGILTTENKALIGGVNEINEKISVINGNITDINQTITNIGSGTSGAIFKKSSYTSIALSRDISGGEKYIYETSLQYEQPIANGYVPLMLIEGYAGNGINVTHLTYNELSKTLSIYLQNPYSDTRNCGVVNYGFLYVKKEFLA